MNRIFRGTILSAILAMAAAVAQAEPVKADLAAHSLGAGDQHMCAGNRRKLLLH